MKIALVVRYMSMGGLEIFVLRLGRFLVQRGHEVTVVATQQSGDWWPKVAEAGMHGVAVPLMGSFNRLTHVRRIHQMLKGYDAIILNDARYGQAAIPGLRSDCVIFSIIHNHDEPSHSIGCGNSQALDAVVAVSPKVRDEAASRVGKELVSQIFYGIPLPSNPPALARVPISDTPRLIYAGRIIQQQKGVFLLPEILAELNKSGVRASLDIVGDGVDLAELKVRIERAGVAQQARYWGGLSPEEVARKLQESHILLMPSFYEGFGLISLEAQGCGCVPIISRLPGVTEWNLVDGMTGLFGEPGNAKSFAEGVLSLVSNPTKWQAMSEAGVKRIPREFSIEKMGDNYLALIEQLRARKQAGANGKRPGRAWNPKLIGYTAPLPNSLCQRLGIL
jgi:glycosyltransferase involved in cell wall biosynthesis